MNNATVQELIRQTMADLLEIPDVGDTDNFISIGGDSLAAIRLQWRLEEATGVELNVAEDILVEPTPRAIAKRVASKSVGVSGG